MAIMIASRTLRETADGQLTGVQITEGTVVEVLDDRTPPWTKIRVKPTGPEGWVSDGAIDKTSDVLGPLSREEVAWECVDLAQVFDINAFYLMTVAQVRSNVSGSRIGDGPCIGPIGFSPEEWARNATQPEWSIAFSAAHLTDWRAQLMVFAGMASTRQRAMAEGLFRQPSMAQLFLAQTLGVEAALMAIATPTTDVAALVSKAKETAATDKTDPANLEGRDKAFLSTDAETTLAQIASQLDAALEAIRGPVRSAVETAVAQTLARFGPARPVAGINLESPKIPAGRQAMAILIAEMFAKAGFGAIQQIAAIANAIAESGLDPDSENLRGEMSYGLFQLNQDRGVGKGFPPAELKDPRRNIEIMLADIGKRYQDDHRKRFIATSSLREAVEIFVHHFERPADKPGETIKRFEIAQTLIS
jgi:hypothetical protein